MQSDEIAKPTSSKKDPGLPRAFRRRKAAPSLAEKGGGRGASLYTLQGIKAFVFGQKGLMANIGFKATKISQYTPNK